MKHFNSSKISLFSIPGMFVVFLLLAHGAALAQVTVKPPSSQIPLPANIQVNNLPKPKLCPDLKVSLSLTKGNNGLVTIHGTVTNVGKGDYTISSMAEIIMNLSYPPQYSYAMSGVSDILISKSFTKLKAGASFPVNGTYQIPNFIGWYTATAAGNAKRLFTLRVVKQDMSPYKPGEDCNPTDNSKSVEVMYHESKH